jgi:hypothetical protein
LYCKYKISKANTKDTAPEFTNSVAEAQIHRYQSNKECTAHRDDIVLGAIGWTDRTAFPLPAHCGISNRFFSMEAKVDTLERNTKELEAQVAELKSQVAKLKHYSTESDAVVEFKETTLREV